MSKRKPYDLAAPAPDAQVYWTSLEAKHATGERAAELQLLREREFPDGVSEGLDPVSRRSFMSIMGAGIALATMEGCRRPLERVEPYSHMPENVIPGVPAHYATVMNHRGEALGLLVESHEGRPTKIEGNPDHPASQGAADLIAQASVLDLYDPDRSRQPAEGTHDRTWGEFDHAFEQLAAQARGSRGEGLRILSEPSISPTFLRLRDRILAALPNARFHTYDPLYGSNVREGARLAFGAPVHTVYAFDSARVILGLDADFLHAETSSVRNGHTFASGRRLHDSSSEMSRFYQVESACSVTGTNADHRLRLPSRDIEGYLMALAARLVAQHHVDLGEIGAAVRDKAAPAGVSAQWINAVAADLASPANRQQAFVVVGQRQPPTVHALAHAINAALGSSGHTVVQTPVADGSERDHVEDIRALCEAMGNRQVSTLIILGGNPVYDAPADLDFGGKLANVATSVHVSSHRDETSLRASWHAPRSHFLESWGDQRSIDGTTAVQQPLIAPLYSSRSDIEILAVLADTGSRRGYDLVQATMRGSAESLDTRAFDRNWRGVLNRGVVIRSALAPMSNLAPRAGEIATALRGRAAGNPISRTNLEAVFVPDNKLGDGRHANNAWLVELPDPMTKIVWDNAAVISPTMAHELGIRSGDVLRITKDGRHVEIPAWVQPGQTDWSIALPLGWGRTHAGRIGDGKGFDVYPLRASHAMHFVEGVEVIKTDTRYRLVQTQEHHHMEGRPIALDMDLAQYKENPRFAEQTSPTPRTLPLWRGVDYNHHKWGMVIDLNACTGCSACVIACQSENNIPVVGKDQVARGREMHWLRVDRYFVGHDEHDPPTMMQPVACVQCENAPCENVCPVNATNHSPEGLNDMAYNRCIGTRYCSNNCPYKVRRFNYLNWHNDGPYQPQDPEVPETLRMQHNPNVTVRFRGVIEKCTYCVQRIQSKKIIAKRENRPLGGDEIVTACQQTCPAHAIKFGDLNDPNAHVTRWAANERGYHLLGEIGTRPRTTHLARIRNPNREMQG